ncbi:hypothetical protein [Roseovarius pacificus]|uniref:hypothetical protein n=1 Tax=Roseovarius pacificus TaxID=337701 RepID=UPI002A1869E1|nr:hypothetical protein [Roseovarius pacificus]
MTESEREKVKLRANYINGVAIAFAAVAVIAPLYGLVYNPTELKKFAVGIFIAFGGGMSSWELHGMAQRTLSKLDDD